LLIACTAIVAIGVVLESAEDWFPSGKPSLDINTGTFKPSPFIRWRKTVINLGWQLVIIGVIGEGIVEVATSGADEMLQQFNNTQLALTTEQAGSAAKSAKTAHDEANAADVVAKMAKGEADSVAKQTADLDRQLGVAKKQLEAVDAKRAELEKSLKIWPSVTRPERKSLPSSINWELRSPSILSSGGVLVCTLPFFIGLKGLERTVSHNGESCPRLAST
jgi:hypothetical protein